MKKKKVEIATLGCRTNQYESQGYLRQLKEMGYELVGEGEKADLCIVNTCTVTQGADRSSRHQIRSLLKKHPEAKLAVTGCMVENHREALYQLAPDRIEVVPNREKERLVEKIFPDIETFPEFKIETFEAHTRAFVKVQDGCNSFCTYCVIPYVRGRSRSRPMQQIVEEVRGLVENGYKEVVLTGINVGDFNGGGTLADLVRAVDRVEGLKLLRISSIDPDEVDEDLTRAVLEGRATCPSMHIVLQSGSNVILKRMNRKYTVQMFLDTLMRLKSLSSDFTVTTDLIVGFPGETERDFAETMEMVTRAEFAKVHMFPYSKRERTRAALYPNQVAPEVIATRKRELLHHSERVAFRLREKFLKKEMSVLLEGEEDGGYISGHTSNFLKVSIPKKHYRQNDWVKVRLIENRADGFLGEVV